MTYTWYGRSTEDRFWMKVDRSGDCWLWKSNVDHKGYGLFKVRQVQRLAHRVAYELTFGEIPDGLTIDHLCRTKLCQRPDHMEVVTSAENSFRARRIICKRGHVMIGANVCIGAGGRRRCRTCRNETSRKYQAMRYAGRRPGL